MADQWHQLYFEDWVEREGLELIKGHRVDNVYSQPLRPWDRTGGNAVQIQLDGTGELNATYIQEIPAGGQLKVQRHLYEELVFVLSGRGSTRVWYPGAEPTSFEWQENSLFAIPLNAYHQHFNGSGVETARYIALTTAPLMLNVFRDDEFIFENDARFTKRYNSEADYFSGKVKNEMFLGWDMPLEVHFCNFWPNIQALDLVNRTNRGVGTRSYSFELANGIQNAHLMEVPGGTFTKLHRHGPGAHVLWLQGEGYSILQPEGGEMTKEEWGRGTMFVPPNFWWHQHCVTSPSPARHLALKMSSRRNIVTRANTKTLQSTKTGGNQMDFEDTPPEVLEELRRIFVEECTRRGTPMHMEPVFGV